MCVCGCYDFLFTISCLIYLVNMFIKLFKTYFRYRGEFLRTSGFPFTPDLMQKRAPRVKGIGGRHPNGNPHASSSSSSTSSSSSSSSSSSANATTSGVPFAAAPSSLSLSSHLLYNNPHNNAHAALADMLGGVGGIGGIGGMGGVGGIGGFGGLGGIGGVGGASSR